MFEIRTLLILIPALPLAAALLTAVLGPRVLRQRSHVFVVTAIGLAFAAAVVLLFRVQQFANERAGEGGSNGLRAVGAERVFTLWSWAKIERAYAPAADMHPRLSMPSRSPALLARDFNIDVTLRADPLTAIMLVTVTAISLLVAVYSIGYMQHDPGYWRFFSYIALFVFSMTMLVSVSNFVMLYVFWEAVGLCSYLLIGFWFEKPAAAAAGKKAFLVNRIGDFGFALGLFLLWTTYGTLDFHDTVGPGGGLQTAGILGQFRLLTPGMYASGGLATAICLLLMLGACGKSAQFPLHVWLPDAMEGPTPVSALIHAATMVTAGVYMVARCTPLFAASADACRVVALIGGITALLGALIALTQTDLKRILAYSTISQLGYMFLGLGVGTVAGITAGMFHLFTHAFFKALLFLGAGSVMHAMGGVIDIRQFGGLWRRMPTTHWTFLFGCLALAGAVPFAGFWSKDQIFVALSEQGGRVYQVLYLVAICTALLTAFYAFRAYFVTFFGPEKIPAEAGHHAHESPRTMTVPLVILAFCSLVVGAYFEFTHGFANFLARTPSIAYLAQPGGESVEHAGGHQSVMITSILVSLSGIGLAAVLYLGSRKKAALLAEAAQSVGLYQLSRDKFYFDLIYNLFVVWPLQGIANMAAWFDRNLIDSLVDFCGWIPRATGAMLRPLQGGMLQFYALAMVLGLLVLIGLLMM
jgi:NADH-quinone oxidoreductase subunit L